MSTAESPINIESPYFIPAILILIGSSISILCSAIMVYYSCKAGLSNILVRIILFQGLSTFLFALSSMICDIFLYENSNSELSVALIAFSTNLSAVCTAHLALCCFWKAIIRENAFEQNYNLISLISVLISALLAYLTMIFYDNDWYISYYVSGLIPVAICFIIGTYCHVRIYSLVRDVKIANKQMFIGIIMVLLMIQAPAAFMNFLSLPQPNDNILYYLEIVYIFLTKAIGIFNLFVYGNKLCLMRKKKIESETIDATIKYEEEESSSLDISSDLERRFTEGYYP